jgi:hypothetical protein
MEKDLLNPLLTDQKSLRGPARWLSRPGQLWPDLAWIAGPTAMDQPMEVWPRRAAPTRRARSGTPWVHAQLKRGTARNEQAAAFRRSRAYSKASGPTKSQPGKVWSSSSRWTKVAVERGSSPVVPRWRGDGDLWQGSSELRRGSAGMEGD